MYLLGVKVKRRFSKAIAGEPKTIAPYEQSTTL
jgi:hypothetical protein